MHEAELELGEAVYESEYLARAHEGHERYLVAWANSCAEVHELLRDRRPAEAASYLRVAAAIWHRALTECLHVATFRSGVHGPECDLDWFQRTYPDQTVDQAPARWRRQRRTVAPSAEVSCSGITPPPCRPSRSDSGTRRSVA